MAIEKFKDVRLDGSIKINLGTKIWEADKRELVDVPSNYIGYVFMVIFPDNKIYIGLTTKRIEVSYYGSGGKNYRALIRSVGRKNLIKHILCFCNTTEELAEKESHYIKLYQSTDASIGYNKCLGQHPNTLVNNGFKGSANPMYGKTHSDQSKHKISEVSKQFKGSANPMYGRTHSEKTREKLRKANIGKVMPTEVKEKISGATRGNKNHFFGKKHSEDTINKISAANSRGVSKYDLDWQLVAEYSSIKLASKSIEKGNIVDALAKGYRKAGGYFWVRKNEDINNIKKLFDNLN